MRLQLTNDVRKELHVYAESIGVTIKSMSYNHASKIVKLRFDEDPSEAQKTLIRDSVPVLTRIKQLTGIELYDDIFTNITPVQVENYVDNNVTDLASAKVFLKRLGKAVLFLYKKLEE